MDNSGYIEINVNGEMIGLRFGIPAVRMYLEKIASDNLVSSDDTINEIGIATLIHCGYINNCLYADISPVKKFGFFLAFIEDSYMDESMMKQIEAVSMCYAESKYTKKAQENMLNASKKKTLRKK